VAGENFFCENRIQKLAFSMTRPSCADPFSVQVCITVCMTAYGVLAFAAPVPHGRVMLFAKTEARAFCPNHAHTDEYQVLSIIGQAKRFASHRTTHAPLSSAPTDLLRSFAIDDSNYRDLFYVYRKVVV
jgi:hypothetical protein